MTINYNQIYLVFEGAGRGTATVAGAHMKSWG